MGLVFLSVLFFLLSLHVLTREFLAQKKKQLQDGMEAF